MVEGDRIASGITRFASRISSNASRLSAARRAASFSPMKRGAEGVQRVHPYAWLWESLESEPSFVLRAMFGTKAVYLDGRLVLCFSAQAEPWRGMLVCTEQGQHAALCADFPGLAPHPVLPKWLYLPEADKRFEEIAVRLVAAARRRDSRFGVVPRPRARSRRRAGSRERPC